MQLNNLVIISIPYPQATVLCSTDSQPSSPCKSLNKAMSQKDDIAWKKSVSAFKKFKGKKDKEAKSTKNSQTNIAFLQHQYQDPLINKNFSLVDNDIKFSLLDNLYHDDIIKSNKTFDYFDPNSAPFFEYGVTYQYLPKQGKVQSLQDEQEPLKLAKRSSTLKLKKQISKKQKIRQQNPQTNQFVKTQKSCSSQHILPVQVEQLDDPFIIIKAPQKRNQILQCTFKSQRPKKDDFRKSKIIKKSSKYSSRPPSVYSHDIYSMQRSSDQKQSESQQSDDYGMNELPMIQFDLCPQICSLNRHEEKQQNGIDSLPIYEIKENSNSFARIRPYQNSTEILQEYQFNSEFANQGKNINSGTKQQISTKIAQSLEHD